jgi:hypothetical protein
MKFKGYYFKHENKNRTIAFIVGKAGDSRFIQAVTDENAYWFDNYGGCKFGDKGAIIDIKNKKDNIKGCIQYGRLTPIKYDIMGPFKYVPMECSHGIISMRHKLNGWVSVNGDVINLDGGLGYTEKDSGVSFPKSYIWLQCNFKQEASISLSIADIPFYGFNFQGCICVVYSEGREYRFATYLGVRILCSSHKEIILKQGKYLLVVNISPRKGHDLPAPQRGRMNRVINECLACPAHVKLYENGKLLFDLRSERASFEAESAKKTEYQTRSPS